MRRARRVLLLVAVLLLLLAGAAPWLAGLGPVRRHVAALIGRTLGRAVDLGGLEAGWASGVEVQGLSVAGLGGEFGSDPLLEAASVRIRTPLHRLILGGGDTDVEVDGLRVRLEEQAGGRTNVADLVERFGKAPAEEKVERKPVAFRVRLTDARLTYRRLPRRPPAEPVDPFEADPVILPAGEGAIEVALERFELDLAAEPASTRVRFGGVVRVDGAPCDVRGSVDVAGGVVRGNAEVKGADLALLERFLGRAVAGTLDVAVDGEVAQGSPLVTVRASVRDLAVADFREERVDVSARVEGKRLAEALVTTASGLRLEGSGTPEDLAVEGRHPRATFSVRRTGDAVSGTAHLVAVAMGRLPPRDVDVAFDVALAADAAEIRRLEVRAPDLELRGKGTVGLEAPFPGEVSCEGAADLRLLAPLLEERADVAGRAALDATVRVAQDGSVALRATGEVRDLVVRRVFDEELRRDRALFEIEAALEEGRDVLRVTRGRIDDVAFEGRAAGLRTGEIREVSGGVKGTVALSPLLPRLAGLRDVQDLEGRVAIDVQAATDDSGVTVGGSATVTGLRFAGYGRRLDHDRIDVRVKVARPPGGAWSGLALATAAPVLVDVMDLTVAGGRFEARGKIEVADLAALPLLPAPLHIDGGLGGTFRASADSLEADLHSGSLTALWDGHGLEAADTTLSVRGRRDAGAWSFASSAVRVPGATVTLGEGASASVEAVLEELARAVPDLAPYAPRGRVAVEAGFRDDRLSLAARLEGVGATLDGRAFAARAVKLEASGSREGAFALDTTLEGFGDGEAPPVRVVASGTRGDILEVRDLRVEMEGAKLSASGDVGDRADLRLLVEGDVAAVARHVPGMAGSGPFRVEATLSAPRPGADGPVVASGELAFGHAALDEIEVRGTKGTFFFRGLLADSRVEPVSLSLKAAAERFRRGASSVDGCDVAVEGAGAPFLFRGTVTARSAHAQDIPLTGIRADLHGEVERWDTDTLRALGAEGTLSFARLVAGATEWTEGSAAITIRDRMLRLTDLKAAVNGGTVEGSGSMDLASERGRWELHATSKDVRLTERIADPLSYLVPVLRMKKGKGSVSGTLDARLDLSGEGTGADAIRRSLAGNGKVHFRQVDLKGSILMGELLSAVRRLAGDDGQSFEDLDVTFAIRGGRVKTEPFELKSAILDLECDGDVGLDGSLDVLLVPRIKAVALPLPLAFRVKGHLDSPKLRPAALNPFR